MANVAENRGTRKTPAKMKKRRQRLVSNSAACRTDLFQRYVFHESSYDIGPRFFLLLRRRRRRRLIMMIIVKVMD